jgi:hypothetical protein
MDNQSSSHGLWDRKTYTSAAVSALLAAAVAFTVCAVRGDTLALGQAASVSVSDSHTGASTGALCLAGGK